MKTFHYATAFVEQAAFVCSFQPTDFRKSSTHCASLSPSVASATPLRGSIMTGKGRFSELLIQFPSFMDLHYAVSVLWPRFSALNLISLEYLSSCLMLQDVETIEGTVNLRITQYFGRTIWEKNIYPSMNEFNNYIGEETEYSLQWISNYRNFWKRIKWKKY